jgi:hypothetical protein
MNNVSGISRNTVALGGDGGKSAMGQKQTRLKSGIPMSGGKPMQDIWITKWVDYSTKYGLGYLLLNGATGVYFNDSTKIILSPCTTYFDYIERQTIEGKGNATN